ncbi:RNA-directed DNA polymerase, partial [Salmonella enterica]|nr:RNA-directed DNA polymerase [Salmonella enterica]
TDIRGYYARISKSLLYEQLCRYVSSPVLRDLLCQFLHYSVEDGGEFHTPLRGIPRGSALSPLLAAFHLTETDNAFSRNRHVTYARYMDDFLILSPTRWHLRRAVRMLNRHFAQAGFEQHPDKTFIGRVEKGFDWMGFWFTEKGCDGVAPRALQNFTDRLRRLYERVRQWPEDLRLRRMAGYVRAWRRWSSFAQMGSVQTCGTDVAGDVVDLCHEIVADASVGLV